MNFPTDLTYCRLALQNDSLLLIQYNILCINTQHNATEIQHSNKANIPSTSPLSPVDMTRLRSLENSLRFCQPANTSHHPQSLATSLQTSTQQSVCLLRRFLGVNNIHLFKVHISNINIQPTNRHLPPSHHHYPLTPRPSFPPHQQDAMVRGETRATLQSKAEAGGRWNATAMRAPNASETRSRGPRIGPKDGLLSSRTSYASVGA
jgi:hypothetical protein